MSIEVAVNTDGNSKDSSHLRDEENASSNLLLSNDKYLNIETNSFLLVSSGESSADEYQQQRLLLPVQPTKRQSSTSFDTTRRVRSKRRDCSVSSSNSTVQNNNNKNNNSDSGSSCCCESDHNNDNNNDDGGGDYVNKRHHQPDKINIINSKCIQKSETKLDTPYQHCPPSHPVLSKSMTMNSSHMGSRKGIKIYGKFPKSSSWRTQMMQHFSTHISDLLDILIRIVFVVVFCKMETTTAFKRFIHLSELPLYQNPRTEDYISPIMLLVSVTMSPLLITLLHLFLTNDGSDFRAATWTWTLVLCLNGFTTSVLKVSVGRPRPDYYYRCFPDGVMILKEGTPITSFTNLSSLSVSSSTFLNMMEAFNCTGNWRDINEGRKSFPSGHSSCKLLTLLIIFKVNYYFIYSLPVHLIPVAFASFGFVTYYISGKLHAFNRAGRGESWRLCLSLIPMILAMLVAISRTCDYHHHWQDVVVGSLIGIFVSYGVYRLYYPSIFSMDSHKPHSRELMTINSSTQRILLCTTHHKHSANCCTTTTAGNRHRRRRNNSSTKATYQKLNNNEEQEQYRHHLTDDDGDEQYNETEVCTMTTNNPGQQLLLTNETPNNAKTLSITQQRYNSKCI